MKRITLFFLLAMFFLCAAPVSAQREVVLHKHEILMILGAEGGFNSNVGDVGARVDYFPTKQFGIGVGIGTAFGVPRWTAGVKVYIGDPEAGFFLYGGYSGNAKRDGVEVSDVEVQKNNQTSKQTVKVMVDPISTVNLGVGFQFMVAGPVNLGVYTGYMIPTKKKDESFSDPRWNNEPVSITSSGNNSIISEIPGGMMIGLTLGFTLFK